MMEKSQSEQITATSRFKPSKLRQRQQQSSVVDDWDAESSDDDNKNPETKAIDAKSAQQNLFRASNNEWTQA